MGSFPETYTDPLFYWGFISVKGVKVVDCSAKSKSEKTIRMEREGEGEGETPPPRCFSCSHLFTPSPNLNRDLTKLRQRRQRTSKSNGFSQQNNNSARA